MDFQGQLLYIAQKKRNITKILVFIYNKFNYIKWIYTIKGCNSYNNIY